MSALSLKNLKDNPERLATLIDKVKKGSPFTRVGGKIEEKIDDVYLEFLYPEIENALLEKKGLTNKDISGAGKNKIFNYFVRLQYNSFFYSSPTTHICCNVFDANHNVLIG